MKMENLKLSLFKGSAGEKKGDYTIHQIAKIITENEILEKTTKRYRELLASDVHIDEKKQFKAYNFPMVKPLGVFNELGSKGFDQSSYTSLCAFDIDAKDHPQFGKTEWDDLFVRIMSNPHVAFVFESPSKGLKGCFLLNYEYQGSQDWYDTVTQLVYPKFETEWGVKFDVNQARMHMGMFLSYDPYAHFNADPTPFEPNTDLRPTRVAPEYSKDDFRIKKFQWLLDNLKSLEGGQIWEMSKNLGSVAAKMVKGGSIPLSPDDVKMLMWEALKQAPGVRVPKKARTDIWNAFDWAMQNDEVVGISDDDLKLEEVVNQLVREFRHVKWDDGSCPYIAVGNDYYYVTPEGVSGKKGKLLYRKHEVIRRKHPAPRNVDVLTKIPHYEDFVYKPNFLNFEKIVDGVYYNQASALPCEPIKGDFPTIKGYIAQLFGENEIEKDQEELIYDMLKIMLEKPEKKVPVLSLVSRTQGTGKSFFFELLKIIFGEDNCIMVNYDSFLSDFNSSWATKYIVFIDEIPENKSEQFYNKIKAITYQNTIQINEKFISKYEIENYIHFFMTSNHVDSFVKIEDQDSRMWIREVPKIKRENYDKDIFPKMQKEAPHFLEFLLARDYTYDITHRFAFEKDLYQTERWKKVIEHQKSAVYHHLKEKIREEFETTTAKDYLVYQKKDFKVMLEDYQYRWGIKDLDNAINEFGFVYKNNTGNRKGYQVTRQQVGADEVEVKNSASDQSNAFKLL